METDLRQEISPLDLAARRSPTVTTVEHANDVVLTPDGGTLADEVPGVIDVILDGLASTAAAGAGGATPGDTGGIELL